MGGLPVRQIRHLFYAAMGRGITGIVFAGFARSYFLKSWFDQPPLTATLHVHGVLATAWLLLFIIQTGLIAASRRATHMALGMSGAALAALVVAGTFVAAIESARTGNDEAVVTAARLYSSMLLASMFGLFVAAGIAYRRRPELHKRFMLLAMIALMGPGANRAVILVVGQPVRDFHVALIAALVVAALIYDWRTRGRPHPAMLWGGVLLVAVEVTRRQIGMGETWQRVAALIMG